MVQKTISWQTFDVFFAQADREYWPRYQWAAAEDNCKSIRVIWHNLKLAQYFAIVLNFMGNQSISVFKKYVCSQNTFSLCCTFIDNSVLGQNFYPFYYSFTRKFYIYQTRILSPDVEVFFPRIWLKLLHLVIKFYFGKKILLSQN